MQLFFKHIDWLLCLIWIGWRACIFLSMATYCSSKFLNLDSDIFHSDFVPNVCRYAKSSSPLCIHHSQLQWLQTTPLSNKRPPRAYWVCRHAHCVAAVLLNGVPRGWGANLPTHLWPVPLICVCVHVGSSAAYPPSVCHPLLPKAQKDKTHTPDARMPIQTHANDWS